MPYGYPYSPYDASYGYFCPQCGRFHRYSFGYCPGCGFVGPFILGLLLGGLLLL